MCIMYVLVPIPRSGCIMNLDISDTLLNIQIKGGIDRDGLVTLFNKAMSLGRVGCNKLRLYVGRVGSGTIPVARVVLDYAKSA